VPRNLHIVYTEHHLLWRRIFPDNDCDHSKRELYKPCRCNAQCYATLRLLTSVAVAKSTYCNARQGDAEGPILRTVQIFQLVFRKHNEVDVQDSRHGLVPLWEPRQQHKYYSNCHTKPLKPTQSVACSFWGHTNVALPVTCAKSNLLVPESGWSNDRVPPQGEGHPDSLWHCIVLM